MGQMKTPGVYIVEKNAFPNSVVEVATAVPAFIGYTEKADNKGKSLLNKPWRITSMSDYHNYFGFSATPEFEIAEKPDDEAVEADFSISGKEYVLNQTAGNYLLYNSMRLFFQNGGGPCYVVSVGDYESNVDAKKLRDGINLLIKEQEPTLVVIPEAVLLDVDNSISVQQAALQHCGNKMKNRFALLDIWQGNKDRQTMVAEDNECVSLFRSKLGVNNLDYGAAYYPWVNTTIVQDAEISYENIANKEKLQELLSIDMGVVDIKQGDESETGEAPEQNEKTVQRIQAIKEINEGWPATNDDEELYSLKKMLNNSLITMSPLFKNVLAAMKEKLNLLPPASAMAGIFTMVDNSRGVWKAPANVSMNAVVSPTVNITHDEQEDLNVTTQGKSINAIRSFIGEGTLVWGARTLDGNSLDWRYINVRRTMIMLEESIRLASKAYVFEPNDANTWVTIKSMIRNFLTGIWKRGGLAGAIPDDAFSVHVGLGESMTSEDILEGILRVTVLVAISRPAEFIEITFQQQMQKS